MGEKSLTPILFLKMSTELVKTHKTVTVCRKNYEAGITIYLSGAKGMDQFDSQHEFNFHSQGNRDDEWSLLLSYEDDGITLEITHSSNAESVQIYDGRCTVKLPSETIEKECIVGLIPAGTLLMNVLVRAFPGYL